MRITKRRRSARSPWWCWIPSTRAPLTPAALDGSGSEAREHARPGHLLGHPPGEQQLQRLIVFVLGRLIFSGDCEYAGAQGFRLQDLLDVHDHILLGATWTC